MTVVSMQVLHYKRGDYFGELAVLHNEPRAASVVAKTEVRICVEEQLLVQSWRADLAGLLLCSDSCLWGSVRWVTATPKAGCKAGSAGNLVQ